MNYERYWKVQEKGYVEGPTRQNIISVMNKLFNRDILPNTDGFVYNGKKYKITYLRSANQMSWGVDQWEVYDKKSKKYYIVCAKPDYGRDCFIWSVYRG